MTDTNDKDGRIYVGIEVGRSRHQHAEIWNRSEMMKTTKEMHKGMMRQTDDR